MVAASQNLDAWLRLFQNLEVKLTQALAQLRVCQNLELVELKLQMAMLLAHRHLLENQGMKLVVRDLPYLMLEARPRMVQVPQLFHAAARHRSAGAEVRSLKPRACQGAVMRDL